MEIQAIIKELEALKGPSRRVDKMLFDLVSTLDGGRNVTDVQNIPHFTNGINVAYNLLQMIVPNNIGGVSWNKDGSGIARIEGYPSWNGATPAIALCIAALAAYRNQPR